MDEVIESFEAGYRREFDYYGTSQQVKIGKRTATGLALPEMVLEKIFRTNAMTWYPSLREG